MQQKLTDIEKELLEIKIIRWYLSSIILNLSAKFNKLISLQENFAAGSLFISMLIRANSVCCWKCKSSEQTLSHSMFEEIDKWEDGAKIGFNMLVCWSSNKMERVDHRDLISQTNACIAKKKKN